MPWARGPQQDSTTYEICLARFRLKIFRFQIRFQDFISDFKISVKISYRI